MSNLPKMLSKREIELEELEEARYVQSLRDDIEKLQEQLNTAKKALEDIIKANDNLLLNIDGRGDLNKVLDKARQALAAIGGEDE